MRILFLAAVEFELEIARMLRAGTDDCFLCGGIGPEATRRALDTLLAEDGRFDLVVNLGIAGSYTERLPLGSVVQVVTEFFGNRPAEPLHNPAPPRLLAALPQTTGNTVAALEPSWRQVRADIETMEGAAFFENCLRRGLPFAEVRAVSNRVGEIDHARWDIPLALRNLQETLSSCLP